MFCCLYPTMEETSKILGLTVISWYAVMLSNQKHKKRRFELSLKLFKYTLGQAGSPQTK